MAVLLENMDSGELSNGCKMPRRSTWTPEVDQPTKLPPFPSVGGDAELRLFARILLRSVFELFVIPQTCSCALCLDTG